MAKKGTIGAGVALDGEKEFKSAIAGINKDLQVLGSEMKKNTDIFGKNTKSQEALTAQSETLEKRMKTQADKVDTLRDALENAKKEFGENSDKVKNWQIALNRAEGDLGKTKNELEKTTRELQQMGDSAEHSGNKMDNMSTKSETVKASLFNLQNMAGVAAVAIGRTLVDAIGKAADATADFIIDGVMLASDLQEVQNVVDVTFGKNAASINDFALTAGKNFGISQLAAKEYTGTLGSMYKAMGLTDEQILQMSEGLVGLTGDWASFRNATPEEAFEKAKAVVTGEGEALKEYGIIQQDATLNEYAKANGYKESYTQMSMAEKAMLRYNYVMAATKDVQGDFTRTSGGFANQLKVSKMEVENISGTIGQMFLPSLNSMLGEGSGILSQLSADMQAADGDAGKMADAVQVALDDLIDAFDENKEEIKDAVEKIMSIMGEVIAENQDFFVQIGVDITTLIAKGIAYGLITTVGQFGASLPLRLKNWVMGNGFELTKGEQMLFDQTNKRLGSYMFGTEYKAPVKIGSAQQETDAARDEKFKKVVINQTNNITGFAERDAANIGNKLDRWFGDNYG